MRVGRAPPSPRLCYNGLYMDAESAWRAIVSIILILGNAFFVMAEYALVSCRKGQMEAHARKGNRAAKHVVAALGNVSIYVAGVQVAITMFSIGIGSITEPWITGMLSSLFGTAVNRGVSFAIALVLVTFVTVVFGELIPKYVTLNTPNRIALLTILPLELFVALLRPLIWLIQKTGAVALLPFGINLARLGGQTLQREELLLLVKSGTTEGVIEKIHGEILTRAVQIDKLMARDIMVHRLDIQWLDVDTPRDQILAKLAEIPHSRIPVCRGDIDEVEGIVYLHHIVKGLQRKDFQLEDTLRPAEIVPENLTVDKIARMREARTQMLIVSDEYGGTSGLLTLEDVVEEIFGDLEDRLESERASIELFPGGRVSARADVRFDELVSRLGVDLDEVPTDTLATMFVTHLERVPKLGDSIETPLGVLRIENMARNRITRVSLQLASEWLPLAEGEKTAP
jgi:putative hemolysin